MVYFIKFHLIFYFFLLLNRNFPLTTLYRIYRHKNIILHPRQGRRQMAYCTGCTRHVNEPNSWAGRLIAFGEPYRAEHRQSVAWQEEGKFFFRNIIIKIRRRLISKVHVTLAKHETIPYRIESDRVASDRIGSVISGPTGPSSLHK